MTILGIGFLSPWLLTALAALPILWILLRAVPPAPVRMLFPGVILLLGLKDEEQVSDRTPWWLLLLRMLAIAALIIGLAGPVLNPRDDAERGTGPLLVLMDAGWASAPSWTAQRDALEALLQEAQSDRRRVAMMRVTEPEQPVFQTADTWRSRLPGLQPAPWVPGPRDYDSAAAALDGVEAFNTLWLSDGLAHEGRASMLARLEEFGAVRSCTITILQHHAAEML